jgi:putative DNA primase/helicase
MIAQPLVKDDLRLWIDTVYGGSEGGFIHYAIGKPAVAWDTGKYYLQRRTELAMLWPDDAEILHEAIQHVVAAGLDVQVCPYPMSSRKTRGKGESWKRTVVHTDIDGDADAEKVSAIGGFAVASGTPGHAHVYVPLTRSVDLDHHERLCQALGEYMGDADPSKGNDNDMLSVPYGFNLKPTVMNGGGKSPLPRGWMVRPSGDRVDPEKLAELLDVDLSEPARATHNGYSFDGIPAWEAETESVDLSRRRYRKAREALAENTGDRSADQYRIIAAGVDAFMTLPQIRDVINQREDLRERLEERGDDDVALCWHKIVAARKAEYTHPDGDQSPEAEEAVPDAEEAKRPQATGRVIQLISADDIEDRVPQWAWVYEDEGRTLLGAVTLFGGRPGAGKSTAARRLSLSTPRAWSRGAGTGSRRTSPTSPPRSLSTSSLSRHCVRMGPTLSG